jgi:NAD(P)H-nitrite reductase large subunit
MGVGVEAFRGSSTAEEVVLADGSAVSGDLFVIGIGVNPRTELAEAAGLVLDNGIVVDKYLAIAALVEAKRPVNPARLADPDTDLSSL